MANHLKSCTKNLRDWEENFKKIVGADAKRKAREALQDLFAAVIPAPQQVTVSAPETSTISEAQTYSSTAKFVDQGEPSCGATEEQMIEGDVRESSGTFVVDTVTQRLVPEPATEKEVQLVAGWPTESKMTIVGLAPNRRSILARLPSPDGRGVNVERSMHHNWKAGDEIACRLLHSGHSPFYRRIA